MTPREFHAGLRALRNIDRHELAEAGVIGGSWQGDNDWSRFQLNPFHFAIQIDDDRYERLFGLVEKRLPGTGDR